MPITILIAVLFGALLHAAWNVFIRAATDKHLNMVLVAGGAGLLTACWLPFAAVPAIASWPYLAVSVLIHVLYFSFVAQLYRKAELTFDLSAHARFRTGTIRHCRSGNAA